MKKRLVLFSLISIGYIYSGELGQLVKGETFLSLAKVAFSGASKFFKTNGVGTGIIDAIVGANEDSWSDNFDVYKGSLELLLDKNPGLPQKEALSSILKGLRVENLRTVPTAPIFELAQSANKALEVAAKGPLKPSGFKSLASIIGAVPEAESKLLGVQPQAGEKPMVKVVVTENLEMSKTRQTEAKDFRSLLVKEKESLVKTPPKKQPETRLGRPQEPRMEEQKPKFQERIEVVEAESNDVGEAAQKLKAQIDHDPEINIQKVQDGLKQLRKEEAELQLAIKRSLDDSIAEATEDLEIIQKKIDDKIKEGRAIFLGPRKKNATLSELLNIVRRQTTGKQAATKAKAEKFLKEYNALLARRAQIQKRLEDLLKEKARHK